MRCVTRPVGLYLYTISQKPQDIVYTLKRGINSRMNGSRLKSWLFFPIMDGGIHLLTQLYRLWFSLIRIQSFERSHILPIIMAEYTVSLYTIQKPPVVSVTYTSNNIGWVYMYTIQKPVSQYCVQMIIATGTNVTLVHAMYLNRCIIWKQITHIYAHWNKLIFMFTSFFIGL